jgi:putative transposase
MFRCKEAQAHEVVQQAPQRVATDGHPSYPRAIKEELGEGVKHEARYRGNPIDQSHRGVKQRYYPTLGFGVVESAQRFYQAYDEVRNFMRSQCSMAEVVSLSERRERFMAIVNGL